MTAAGHRRHDNQGRSTGAFKPHKVGKLKGPFVGLSRELLASPAWGVLTLADRKVLDRLCIEHMAHAGTENGNLKCTYADFEAYGIRRATVPASLRRLEALGFIEVVERGRISRAEFKFPARYRLTFVQGNLAATNEWQHVATPDEAMRRAELAVRAVRRQRKEKKPDAKTLPDPDAISLPLSPIPGRENATQEPDAITLPLSISREGSPAAQQQAPGPAKLSGQGKGAMVTVNGWQPVATGPLTAVRQPKGHSS
jgi:hypothetical protein